MSGDSTVFEALQLLQNKSIDDVILENILLHDSTQKCLVISLPNVKIHSFQKYFSYKRICKDIFKYCNRFVELDAKIKSIFCLIKNLNGDYVCTMRFVTVDIKDFERMSPWLVTHIKKIFYDK